MSKMQCKGCRRFFDPNIMKTCPHCNKSNADSNFRRDNNMPYMQDVYDPDPTPSSHDFYSGGGGSFGGGGSSGSWDSGSFDSGSSDSGSSSD